MSDRQLLKELITKSSCQIKHHFVNTYGRYKIYIGPIQPVSSRLRPVKKFTLRLLYPLRNSPEALWHPEWAWTLWGRETISDPDRFQTPVLQVCIQQPGNYSKVVVAPLSVFYIFLWRFFRSSIKKVSLQRKQTRPNQK